MITQVAVRSVSLTARAYCLLPYEPIVSKIMSYNDSAAASPHKQGQCHSMLGHNHLDIILLSNGNQ